MTDDPIPNLLTARDVARQMQVSLRTIWRLCSAGKLPKPIRLGGSVRWNEETVRQWIKQGCPASLKRN